MLDLLDVFNVKECDQPRVYLSACSCVCYLNLLAEKNSSELFEGEKEKTWETSKSWIALVEDKTKKAQLLKEFSRSLSVALKQVGIEAEACSMVKSDPWCHGYVWALRTERELSDENVRNLRQCIQKGLEQGVSPSSDAVFLLVAKKVEEIRKTISVDDDMDSLCSSICDLLLCHAQALGKASRHHAEKMYPFVVETIGTCCLILAVHRSVSEALDVLKRVQAQFGKSDGFASKYYNVGVTLHARGRYEEACLFFKECCESMLNVHRKSDDQSFPPHFSDRFRVYARTLELSGEKHYSEALSAAVWAFVSDSCHLDLVLHLWKLCEHHELELAELTDFPLTDEKAREILLKSCKWRPLNYCFKLTERAVNLLSCKQTQNIENAKVELARGEISSARELLKSAKQDSRTALWFAVLELEHGDFEKGSVMLRDVAADDLEDHELSMFCDVLQWFERYDILSGIRQRPTLQLRSQLLTGEISRVEVDEIVGGDDDEEWKLEKSELLISVHEHAKARELLKPLCGSESVWTKCRAQHLTAQCEEATIGAKYAINRSTESVKHGLTAAKSEVEAVSPWKQRLFMLESSSLCGRLHEAKGMVQEAEYFFERAAEIAGKGCPSRSLMQQALLCSITCKRRTVSEAKTQLSEMRSAAKKLQKSDVYNSVLARYKESVADYYLAKWEEGERSGVSRKSNESNAQEAYKRFKQVLVLCGTNEQRALVRVRQGVALKYLGRRDDALAMWSKVMDEPGQLLSAWALACYHYGLETQSLEHLTNAIKSEALGALEQAQACAEAAMLTEDQMMKYKLVCSSIGLTRWSEEQSKPFIADKLSKIPSHWTVVSLSVLESAGVVKGLLITRLEGERRSAPKTVCLNEDGFGALLERSRDTLDAIIKKSDETTKRAVLSAKEKKKWWKDRSDLDQQMKDFLYDLEESWFGLDKHLLRPTSDVWGEKTCLKSLKNAVKKALPKKKKIAWTKIDTAELAQVVNTLPFYSHEDVSAMLRRCCGKTFSAEECELVATSLEEECESVTEAVPKVSQKTIALT